MINKRTQDFLDGMRWAYNDAGDFAEGLIDRMPEELKGIGLEQAFIDMRNTFRAKAVNAQAEAERFLSGVRQ